jgi:hypothetical protein
MAATELHSRTLRELNALIDSDVLLDFLDGYAAAVGTLGVIASAALVSSHGWRYWPAPGAKPMKIYAALSLLISGWCH